MSARFSNRVLVPGWILIFGLVFLEARPIGPALSVLLLMTGVLVVPVLVSIPGHWLASAAGGTIGPRRGRIARLLTLHA